MHKLFLSHLNIWCNRGGIKIIQFDKAAWKLEGPVHNPNSLKTNQASQPASHKGSGLHPPMCRLVSHRGVSAIHRPAGECLPSLPLSLPPSLPPASIATFIQGYPRSSFQSVYQFRLYDQRASPRPSQRKGNRIVPRPRAPCTISRGRRRPTGTVSAAAAARQQRVSNNYATCHVVYGAFLSIRREINDGNKQIHTDSPYILNVKPHDAHCGYVLYSVSVHL